jgi:hypothetical protein
MFIDERQTALERRWGAWSDLANRKCRTVRGLACSITYWLLLVCISQRTLADGSKIGNLHDRETMEHNLVLELQRSGLHDLAIGFCERAIASTRNDPVRLAKRTVWLLEAVVERDSLASSTIKEAIEGVEAIRDKFVGDNSKNLEGLWIKFHSERLRYVLANRAVAVYQSAPANPAPRDDALQAIRTVSDQCEAILVELSELPLGNLASPTSDAKQLSRDSAGLRNRLRHLKIDGMLLRSQSYPLGSNDAIAAGTEALAAIDELRNQVEADWIGRDDLEFTWFRALIAASQETEAFSKIRPWLKALNNDSLHDQAVALVSTTHLRAKRVTDAEYWLKTARSDPKSPHIALLEMQIRIAEWLDRQSKGTSKPDDLQRDLNAILAMKKQIANQFGPYWERRAEAEIVSSGQKLPDSQATPSRTSFDLIQLEISQLIRANNTLAAVERLDQAELLANTDQNQPLAFSLAKTAIGLLQRQSQSKTSPDNGLAWIERAVDRSIRYAGQKDADRLHLAAMESWPSQLVESYEPKLLEHLLTWPESESATVIRRKLIQWCMQTGNTNRLVEAWLVTPSLLENEEGISAFALFALQNKKQDFNKTSANGDVPPNPWEQILGLASRNRVPTGALRITDWLTADLDAWPIDNGMSRLFGKTVDWNLVTQEPVDELNRIAKHCKVLLDLGRQSTLNLKEAHLSKEAIEAWFRENTLGRLGAMAALDLQLSNILRLRPVRPDEESDRKKLVELIASLQRVLASELAALKPKMHPSIFAVVNSADQLVQHRLSSLQGNWQESEAWFIAKRKESPRESIWLLELARLLECQSSSEIERALTLYRQLGNGSGMGTDDWFEARFSSIRCLRKLNRSGEADEVLSTMQVMVPNPSSVWQMRMAGASVIKP